MSRKKENWVWIGIEIPPWRLGNQTYTKCKYEDLPHVDESEYKEIVDLEKLADFLHVIKNDHPLKTSPTSCFFEIDRNSGLFYSDQQGCVVWVLDLDGTVITSNGDYVAKTLPEFLARIAMENSIWYKLLPDRLLKTMEKSASYNKLIPSSWLLTGMTAEEQLYLDTLKSRSEIYLIIENEIKDYKLTDKHIILYFKNGQRTQFQRQLLPQIIQLNVPEHNQKILNLLL